MMNLEEEIFSIEEGASAVVAAARLEAKKLMGTLESKRKQVAEERAARTEAEKLRLKEQYAEKLREKLSEIRREQSQGMEAIEKTQKEKAEGCVRAITEKLLRG